MHKQKGIITLLATVIMVLSACTAAAPAGTTSSSAPAAEATTAPAAGAESVTPGPNDTDGTLVVGRGGDSVALDAVRRAMANLRV